MNLFTVRLHTLLTVSLCWCSVTPSQISDTNAGINLTSDSKMIKAVILMAGLAGACASPIATDIPSHATPAYGGSAKGRKLLHGGHGLPPGAPYDTPDFPPEAQVTVVTDSKSKRGVVKHKGENIYQFERTHR